MINMIKLEKVLKFITCGRIVKCSRCGSFYITQLSESVNTCICDRSDCYSNYVRKKTLNKY